MKLTKLIYSSIFIGAALLTVSCRNKSNVDLKTQADSVAYAIGTNIGTSVHSNMKKDGLDTIINLEIVSKAFYAALRGDSAIVNEDQARAVMQTYFGEMQKHKGEAAIAEGKKFLEENKKKEGVKVLPDGLQYIVEKEGSGASPSETDTVIVDYRGTLINGTEFDGSIGKGKPAEFPLTVVIPGWIEALKMMKVGSKWKVFIPSELAWGERGAGEKIPPNAVVIFEVELLGIKGK